MTNYHIENTIEYEKYFRFTDGSLQCSNDTINNLLNILGLTKELENSEIVTCYFKNFALVDFCNCFYKRMCYDNICIISL